MIPILVVVLICFVLLGWFIVLGECQHKNYTGIANYYDHDEHCFIAMKECDDCHRVFILREV